MLLFIWVGSFKEMQMVLSTGKMAQLIKALAVKPDNFNSKDSHTLWQERTASPNCPLTSTHAIAHAESPHTQVNKCTKKF